MCTAAAYTGGMSTLHITPLLHTDTVTVSDVCCSGGCRHRSAVEAAMATHLVFPYRGVYVRHVGADTAVADVNRVLFFKAQQEYQIAHPVPGGDASLSISVAPALLEQLASMPGQQLRIGPPVQATVAALRRRLPVAQVLEAETLTLDLLRAALALAPPPRVSQGQRRLAERAKLAMAADPARRWTLADVAAETGGSPAYLTQVFQRVEGLPLYRYQTQMRLASALHRIDEYHDLSALAMDLGFSSHSHFSAAFRQAFGRSPSSFKKGK